VERVPGIELAKFCLDLSRENYMQTSTVTLCGRQLDRPTHLCAFFDSREEEYDVLTPYYNEGLAAGEQVITIVDSDRQSDHCSRMAAHGIPVDEARANGQLRVLTAEETYTRGGRFGAQRMYDLLQGALAAAHRNQKRVRTSGVMKWATRGHAGTEELMDYEARVNVLVPIYDCTLLCVYDLSEISGQMVMDVLKTHPYIVFRREVLENPYYVAPIEVLKQVLQPQVAERTRPN
jgi:MEDS: MEthanogen/methylotroph, DcmR Sensory domain